MEIWNYAALDLIYVEISEHTSNMNYNRKDINWDTLRGIMCLLQNKVNRVERIKVKYRICKTMQFPRK